MKIVVKEQTFNFDMKGTNYHFPSVHLRTLFVGDCAQLFSHVTGHKEHPNYM
jgi:hypothetical protein